MKKYLQQQFVPHTRAIFQFTAGVCLIFTALLFLPPHLYAQDTTPPATSDNPNLQQPPVDPASDTLKSIKADPQTIETRIKATRENQSLEQAKRDNILTQYNDALTAANKANELTTQAEQYNNLIKTGPDDLEKLKAQLNQPLDQSKLNIDESKFKYEELALEITQTQNTLKDLQEQLKSLTARQIELRTAPQTLSTKIAKHKTDIDKLTSDIIAKSKSDESGELNTAQLIKLKADYNQARAALNAAEAATATHQIRLQILSTQRELLERRITFNEKLLTAYQNAAGAKRRKNVAIIRQEIEQTSVKLINAPEPIKNFARTNIQLAEELSEIVNADLTLTSEIQRFQQAAERFDKLLTTSQERLEMARVYSAFGPVLHQQQQNYPNVEAIRKSFDQYNKEIKRATVKEVELEKKLRAQRTENTDARDEYLKELTDDQRLDYQEQLNTVKQHRKELIELLHTAYSRYLANIIKLNTTDKQLVKDYNAFANFNKENLLWIPSAEIINTTHAPKTVDALKYYFTPNNYTTLFSSLYHNILSRFAIFCLAVLVSIGLFLQRKRAIKRINDAAKQIRRVNSDRIILSFRTLFDTLILILPIPLMLFTISYILQVEATNTFPLAFAEALQWFSFGLATFLFFKRICQDNGLAAKHFRWSNITRPKMRKNISYIFYVALGFGFLIHFIQATNRAADMNSLGRLLFIAEQCAISFILFRMLRKSCDYMQHLIKNYPDTWLVRTRIIWTSVLILMPIGYAILAAWGYLFTAMQLNTYLDLAVFYIFLVLLSYYLIIRWFAVEHRRLAYEQARKKREELIAQRESDSTASMDEMPNIDEDELDLTQITTHASRIVDVIFSIIAIVGLWYIWDDVFPALNIFFDIDIWETVTLGNLILSLVIATIAIIAASNLPGLLELAILQKLPIQPASRYAISTISQYIIAGIGLTLAFNEINIGWNRVQWLIAALGVGLGFGLQEIVANFVSGLIILLERPFRVGDTVTVSDISGTVARIRIRATTITEWDRKELIVPNKDFITGKVINWTLSDPITRVTVPVGIAYGSDTKLAYELLHKVAKEVPDVLTEPEPSVFFLSFGDNSLLFELRAFVREITNRGRNQIIHELHMAIDDAFRDAKISIAFPQRDIHFDTHNPLQVKLLTPELAEKLQNETPDNTDTPESESKTDTEQDA